MSFTYIRRAAVVVLALAASAGCTIKNTEAPPLSGPSNLALLLSVSATPDSISQDGGSQASIKVTAIGPDGRPVSGLPIRVDMMVNGVPQDYGTLSARSIVTNRDGVATVIYTAPPGPTNGVFGTCNSLPGNCVTIVATATATDFASANPQQVQIRLVPTGIILPPASTPTAAFTISPTPVNFNIASTFDASTSCGGPVVSGVCTSSSAITSYTWTFGDGSSGSGKVVNHTYVASTSPGNSYNVTLTVTNDRGVSSSTTQAVSVNASPAPTGDWVYSPAQPAVGDTIFFNADGLRAAAGHTIVQYNWDFGDGTNAGGAQTTHKYSQGATYVVVLSATDDAGQKTTLPKTIVVGNGSPNASFTSSVLNPATHTMTFDGSGSTSANGSSIVTYQWAFGDGLSGSGQTVNHSYLAAGSYTVRLTVTDSLGRTGSTSASVTVP